MDRRRQPDQSHPRLLTPTIKTRNDETHQPAPQGRLRWRRWSAHHVAPGKGTVVLGDNIDGSVVLSCRPTSPVDVDVEINTGAVGAPPFPGLRAVKRRPQRQ